MDTAIKIIEAAIIPIALFVLNMRARKFMHYTESAATDFVLAIIGFDVAAIAASDVFSNAMHDTIFKQNAVGLFIIMGLGGLILWCTFFLSQEKKLIALANRPISIPDEIPFRFFAVWSLASVIFAGHVFVFLYQ
jgi:hypothetical protein